MTGPIIHRREPALVLVLSIVTFLFYLPFWYHGMYEDLRRLDEKTPTGHGFWLDFLFVLVTFGVYGIWVDYRISQQIAEIEERNGLGPVQDTSIITVILDVAGYATGFVTNVVTSAIHQDQLNRLAERLERRVPTEASITA